MGKIDELIKELCPDGVKYRILSDLGTFFGGLSGKSKKDFTNGNAKFISYMNIFANPAVNLDIKDVVAINQGEKQNSIQYKDILFTGSSETPDECGMSSVVTEEPKEVYYLNSFSFGFRLNDKSLFDEHFLKHYFRGNECRKAIAKTANGVTRFNVSKTKFGKIQIPLPPLSIQQQIVDILDTFTDSISNLQEELNLREKQMEYYRESLLSFKDEEVECKILRSIAIIKNGRDYKHLNSGEIPVFGSGGIMTYVNEFVYDKPTVLIPRKGSLGNLFYVDYPFWNVDTVFYTEIKADMVIPKFLYYYLRVMRLDKLNGAGGVPSLTQTILNKLSIPVPSLSRQQEIVGILDTFESMIANIKEEIELRQKQYEYYREKLLTFERKGA